MAAKHVRNNDSLYNTLFFLEVTMSKHLIIGASSAIAQAMIMEILKKEHSIIAISRSRIPDALASSTNLQWIQCDYSTAGIQSICQQLSKTLPELNSLYICNGILHNQDLYPEKQIKQFKAENFHSVMHVNAALPMIWLQSITPYLSRQQHLRIILFSARIGSIGDNELGGWHSYRASKAALNMLARNYAIEMNRSHKQVSITLFHPGTTNTNLSKPFQKNVAPNKLFEPNFVAQQLLLIMEKQTSKDLSYIDWQGKPIPW